MGSTTRYGNGIGQYGSNIGYPVIKKTVLEPLDLSKYAWKVCHINYTAADDAEWNREQPLKTVVITRLTIGLWVWGRGYIKRRDIGLGMSSVRVIVFPISVVNIEVPRLCVTLYNLRIFARINPYPL